MYLGKESAAELAAQLAANTEIEIRTTDETITPEVVIGIISNALSSVSDVE